MKTLYIAPGRYPELIESVDAERTLKGVVERIHPFLDANICLTALLDREDRKECLVLLDEDLYELDSICGPVLFLREDEEDLTDEDTEYIESHIRCYETEEEEDSDWDDGDDFDGPDDESFSPTHIVDGITFGEMLRNERTEEQKYF